jgi:hypothetical protein
LWSEAIAVGNLNFVEQIRSELGFKAAHREPDLDLTADSVGIQNPKSVLSNAEGSKNAKWIR